MVLLSLTIHLRGRLGLLLFFLGHSHMLGNPAHVRAPYRPSTCPSSELPSSYPSLEPSLLCPSSCPTFGATPSYGPSSSPPFRAMVPAHRHHSARYPAIIQAHHHHLARCPAIVQARRHHSARCPAIVQAHRHHSARCPAIVQAMNHSHSPNLTFGRDPALVLTPNPHGRDAFSQFQLDFWSRPSSCPGSRPPISATPIESLALTGVPSLYCLWPVD